MKFYNYLQEARRNPEKNPRINVVDALKPYKDRQDVFIQFSDINKLGLNPKSKFNTPLGIYSYPLAQVWSEFESNTIPYAGDRKYVIIFSCSHPMLIETNEYNNYMLENDVKFYQKEIFEKYKIKISKLSTEETFLEFKNEWFSDSRSNHPFMLFWNFTRNLSVYISRNSIGKFSSKPMITWNHLLRMRDYVGFTDRKGKGFIHPNESTQAVFLSKKNLKMIDSFLNKRYQTLRGLIMVDTYHDIKNMLEDFNIHLNNMDEIVTSMLVNKTYNFNDFEHGIDKKFIPGKNFFADDFLENYMKYVTKQRIEDIGAFLNAYLPEILKKNQWNIDKSDFFMILEAFFSKIIERDKEFKKEITELFKEQKEGFLKSLGTEYFEYLKKSIHENKSKYHVF